VGGRECGRRRGRTLGDRFPEMAQARGVTVPRRIGSVPIANSTHAAPQDRWPGKCVPRTRRLPILRSRRVPDFPKRAAAALMTWSRPLGRGRSYFRQSFGRGVCQLQSPEPWFSAGRGAAVSGSISIEGDREHAGTSADHDDQLRSRMRMGPQPQSALQSEGTFLVHSVMPGRWRILVVNGVAGL